MGFTTNVFAQKKTKKPVKPEVQVEEADYLTPEERRKYDYFFLEATKLKEKEEYDAAFELYHHCLEIDPNAASALYEISQFYLYLKQTDTALANMQKAVALNPDNFWYKQSLATLYQSKGDVKSAIDIYEDMAKQFSSRIEPLYMLIDLYTRTKDYPMVIRSLERLEEKDGKSEQISMEKFRIYFSMGEDKKAFNEIENLAKEYPHDMRYLSLLGDVYMNNGKQQEAYDTYQKVLSIEPDNALAMMSLVNYYDKTGQEEKYRNQLDDILLNKKVDSTTKLNIMRQLIIQSEHTDRDSTKIINMFEAMLEEDKEDDQTPMLYFQYLASKGMEKETIPVLNRILEIDPENTPARLQLLSYALEETSYEDVIRISETAILYTPETLEFYYYLSLAYYQTDRKEEALEVLKKGIDQITENSNPVLVGALFGMTGEIYHTKGMKSEAFAAYDSALVHNPEDNMTMNNYAYYLSLERTDLDKAEEMSYKTIKAEPTNETFLDTYAWILFEKKRYPEAKIYIDEAMKNGGNESDVVVEHCGDIYYMNGENEEAVKYWLQSREMGNESETLKKKIEQKRYLAQ